MVAALVACALARILGMPFSWRALRSRGPQEGAGAVPVKNGSKKSAPAALLAWSARGGTCVCDLSPLRRHLKVTAIAHLRNLSPLALLANRSKAGGVVVRLR